jgi:rhamnosyltransferase
MTHAAHEARDSHAVRLDVLNFAGMVAITVTYRPDLVLLGAQQTSLRGVRSIVVDNGSGDAAVEALRALIAVSPDSELVALPRNVGLAAGLNAGIDAARRMGATSVLLLDQDSTFGADLPTRLLDALNQVQATGRRLACVGPALIDVATGMPHGFHYIADGWRWGRSSPSLLSRKPFAVANLNGSGTLMSMELVDAVGHLDDDLFIDHIDTDWAFRVKAAGYALFGIPWVHMDHRMGESGRRLWLLGWRVWPERSPRRHYYLFRNTIVLMRRAYVPVVWKAWALMKLSLTAIVAGFDPRRVEHWRMMRRGWSDARAGIMGEVS